MEMSAAALPPRQPLVTERERADPLFPEYARYRASMNSLLVEASAFADWKFQREQNAIRDTAAQHPLYPDFVAWMRETKAGGRSCPAGVFPDNFNFWLTGGRW